MGSVQLTSPTFSIGANIFARSQVFFVLAILATERFVQFGNQCPPDDRCRMPGNVSATSFINLFYLILSPQCGGWYHTTAPLLLVTVHTLPTGPSGTCEPFSEMTVDDQKSVVQILVFGQPLQLPKNLFSIRFQFPGFRAQFVSSVCIKSPSTIRTCFSSPSAPRAFSSSEIQ